MLQDELAALKAAQRRFADVPPELHALYPQVDGVLLAEAPSWNEKLGWATGKTMLVNVHVRKALTKAERGRIEDWLKVRLKSEKLQLTVGTDR